MTDKLVIMNVAAQKQKYGPHGYRELRAALERMVSADKSRGLKTLLVDISNPSQIRKYRVPAVSNPRSEIQNKQAIDAVYAAVRPDYTVLLDGPDVIPHILLKSSIPGDEDRVVPSDLPYASDEKFAARDIAAYASATRVLGRIPGVTGVDDPAFLVRQLRTAASFKSQKPSRYFSHLAISSHRFRKSTERSVDKIFRSAPITTSPPAGSLQIRKMLAPLSHFINCDGESGDPNFYGTQGRRTVVSMSSDDLARRISRGTIVVAECCFGAQLYSPKTRDGTMPIANAYLHSGAIAFFGSTNVAFGSPDKNGSADLIAQYFFGHVLDGASTGRACLQARQDFVRAQKMEDPVNLKTLAQFILLGDPSLQAVRGEAEPKPLSGHVEARAARRTRRIALGASGKSAAECSGFPGRKLAAGASDLHKLVRKVAVTRGFRLPLRAVEGYEIVGGRNYDGQLKSHRTKQSVFVAVQRENRKGKKRVGTPRTRVLVVHAQNNSLTGITEYISKLAGG